MSTGPTKGAKRTDLFAWVGFAGAIASILVALDAYVFDSRLLDILRLPVQVPLGILALVTGSLFVLVVVAARAGGPEKQESPKTPVAGAGDFGELAQAKTEVRRLSEQVVLLESQLADQRYVALKRRVLALLDAERLSLNEIMERLEAPPTSMSRVQVLEVLGDLIDDGTVMGGHGAYTRRYMFGS